MKNGILTEIVIGLICVLALSSCVQREYQHDFIDPNGQPQTRYYKENYFMTDASAESVEVVTPDGTIIRINAPVQDSQNVKIISPAFGVKTESKGK